MTTPAGTDDQQGLYWPPQPVFGARWMSVVTSVGPCRYMESVTYVS